MVLSEATNQIRINYQDVTFDGTGDQGSTATIGLQSRDVLVDQYSFNQANSVVSGSSLVFNRGTASNPTLIVDVPITDDPTFEAAEDFAVQLSNPVGAAIGTTQAVTTIDISDNTAPNAIDDAISTTETTTGTVNVLTDAPGIDTDVEGHTLQVTLVEGTTVPPGGNTTITIASGAMVTLHSDGTAVYDPNGAFNALLIGQQGFDSFTYTVDDGFGGATVATVNVTIDGENQIATFDLDDDGTTANRDNTVMVNPFDPAIAVTAADAVFSDPDDASMVTFDITLGNFQQPGQEVITISGTPITFGTPAATTLNIGGNLVDLTYDGANAIAFTDNGGGEILAADIQTIIRSITYQNISGADLGGIRTLTFDANDGDDVSNSAVGSVNVVGFNIAPVANDDGSPTPFSGIEDTSIIVPALTLLANDSDPDLDPLSIISVQGAVNGSVVLNGGGDPVFTPDLDYFGSASFTYTVSDGRGGTDTATVFLTFTSVNDAPRIDLNGAAAGNDHALTYTENDPAVPIIDLTGTLTDDSTTLTGAQAILTNGQIGDIITVGTVPPGLSIVIIPASAATGLTSASSVSINISGSGTPAEYEAAIKAIRFEAGGENPDTTARVFNVVATDGSQTSVASVTTITVVAVNDDPIANADGPFTTNEDTLLTITPASLLANASDPEGDTPTLLSVQGAVNGLVSINGGGDIEFVPNANFSGAASFTYTIDDGNGGTATATVTITVDPVNDAPTLDLDTGSAGTSFVTNYTENSAGTQIAHTSILLSDIDNVNMDTITVTLTNGQIGDALDVGTLPAGMSVVVSPSVPLTSAGTITVTLSGPATLNDFETALLAVTYRSTSDAPDPSNRILNIEANDGADTSPVAVTTVSITQLPDAPTPQADGVLAATEDTPLVIPVATLLANDTDPDGDILTVVSVQSPVNGTVVLLGGNVTFTPDPEYSGPASFIYVVDDGTGNTAAASVNINVSAVNDAPTVDLDTGSAGVDYSTSYTEDGSAASIVDPSLAIADVDNTSLTGMIVTLTTGRVGDQLLVGALPPGITSMSVPPVPLATDGSMTVTLVGPALIADFETALQAISFHTVSDQPDVTDRTITIVANDGSDMSTVATTTVSVTAVNDAPVGTSDGPLPVNEDSSLIVTAASLLANDTDGENDALSITSVQSPVNGTVSLAAGTITFTPTADYFGPASFTYTVDDGNGGSDTVTVNVSVTSVNDITILDLDTAVAGNDHSTGYTEGGAPVAVVAASVSITDIDDTNIESATIVLTNGLVGDRLEVGTLPAGISAVISPPGSLTSAGVQTVILSGSSSLANYQTALQLVTYQTTSPNPSGVDRDLQINVNDGDNNSATANTVIAMTVVNDAPIAGDDGPYATNENTPIVLTHAALLANDSDGEGDPISITSVQGEVNGSAAIVGSTVVFTPTANYFGPASFTYTVDDGNGGSTVATVNINVILINDAPDLDLDGSAAGNDYAVTYTENSAGVAIADTDASIADPEHANMTGGMVTLTNGFAGDVLEAGTLPAGITATIVPTGPLTGSGPITVTLTGSATQADYATALAAITYRSTSENPSTTTRTVTSVVTDGVDPSLQRTTLVTVVAVDDAPIAGDDGTPLPLAAVEDTPFIFNPVASNDIDYEGAPLTITQINATPIVPGGSVVLIEGLIALDLDGQTLTLTPNANFSGPVSFVYIVSDGALTDTANVNIDFAAVNDAPVALDDGPVVLVEDGSSTFDPVAANDSDVEGDPLTITQIDGQAIAPTGTLALANGSITLAADGTTLQFVPTANYTGQFSISYTVTDGTATDTASLTYDVQSTEDPVTVVSTPSDQTYNDSDNVILPLAAHFFDPDGQTITYSAANLPLGLSIDSSTGVVSGTIDSSASQSGPYTVTVSASDGVTVPASTAFQILVNNIAPVSAPPATVPTGEGDTLSYDVRPLFSDADGDTLTYSAVGLPVWATFNPATGLIGGVVPTNAALAGPVNVTITANDGDGGSTNTTVTIDPFNPSPIRVTSAPDVNLDEGDTFDFDVAGHFVDGGNDTDTLTYSVTGLPSGITFDATLNTISGNIEAGTRRATPYVVALTADDGQGGVTVTTFQIRVGDFSFFADDDPFISLEEFSDAGKDTGSAAPDTAPSITDLVDQLGSLSSTETLEDDSAIILKAVEGIDPLYEATLSGTDDGLPEQVDKMDELSASTNWLSASGRAGNGNWQVDGVDPETPLSEQWEQRSELNTDGRLDKILLETYQKHGSFFIELVNNLDPMRDGQIVRVSMTLADGQPLPEWMKEVRQGIITANPPEGVGEIVLTVLTELGNQNVLTKEFTIDFKNTDAEEPASKEEDKEKETVEKEGEKPDSGSFNDPKSRAALRLEALRGSVETETVQN